MSESMDDPHSQDEGGEVEIRHSPEVLPPRELGKLAGIADVAAVHRLGRIRTFRARLRVEQRMGCNK